MSDKNIISINEFCKIYEVPDSFIDSLFKYELIELIDQDDERFIDMNQLNEIEKMMRLHFDLNINFEGLDVVNNLLDKINDLENEINHLKKRLEFYTNTK